MNKSILSLIFLFISCFTVNQVNAQKQLRKVVIDAGHGGKDPGAIGDISREKDIALAVALKVDELMKKNLPSVKTLLTRNDDFFVELKGRHAIANNASADLYISIHVNSTAGTTTKIQTGHQTVGKGKSAHQVPVYKTIRDKHTQACGTETYVLGLTRTEQKEKAIGAFGDKIIDEPGLMDENDPTTAIIISQYSQAYLEKSVSLASKVQRQFEATGRKNLGVKQKSLEVLAGSAMPGVLIELGFINNVEEEKYLVSEEGQNQLALAIFNAIRDYKIELEKKKIQ